MMNDFDKVYRHQRALFDTMCDLPTPEEQEKCAQQFEQLDEQLRVAFEKFADASGILLILGETNAEAALDEYREAANEWYERGVPLELDPASATNLRADVLARRKALMAKLAVAYKTL